MSLEICLPTPADGRLQWLCLVDTEYQQGTCNPCLHHEWEWVTQSVHSTASFCFWDNSRKAGFDFLNLLIYPSRGKKINATITLGSHLSSAGLTWQMPVCLGLVLDPKLFLSSLCKVTEEIHSERTSPYLNHRACHPLKAGSLSPVGSCLWTVKVGANQCSREYRPFAVPWLCRAGWGWDAQGAQDNTIKMYLEA